MKFTQTIEVSPNMIGKNIKSNVQNIVCKKYTKMCINNVGYIHNVRDISIVEMKTSYCTPSVMTTVTFNASVYKPEVGDVLLATVTKTIPQGVLLQTEFLKVFIPEEKTLTEGKQVSVKITATKYDKNNYNCIATLV